jgi:hypothetical protein
MFLDRLMPVALLLLVGGLVLLPLGWRWLGQDRERAAWPTTGGVLESVRIEKIDLARLESPTRYTTPTPEGKYRRDPVWMLDVKYRYAVGGRSYAGERATSYVLYENASDPSSQPSATLRELQACLLAGPVQVHYHPEDPERSYLFFVPNPAGRSALAYGGGALGLALLYFAGRLLARSS